MAIKTGGAAATQKPAQNSNDNTPEGSDAELASILLPTQGRPAAEAASGEEDQETPESPDHDPEHDEEEDNQAETGDSADEAEASESDAAEDAAAEGDAGDQEQEAGDEPEGDKAPAAGEDLDEEDRKTRAKFTPEQQKLFDKAIQKKARKAKEIQQQLEEKEKTLTQLQQELEEARATPPAPVAPTAENPLLDVADEATLEKRITQARQARRWALAHPQGGIVKDAQGVEQEVTAERVGEILAETEELIQDHAPKRREFIRAATAASLEAEKAYPWLKNKGTAGAVQVESTLRQYPQLKALFPDIKLALADMLIGRNMRLAQKQPASNKGAATGAGKPGASKGPARAPATPAGNHRPARVNPAATQRAGATRSLEATGEDPENQALLSILKSS